MGKKLTFTAILLLLLTACNNKESQIDKTVVQDLQLEKYLGTWYEIARYDNRFEKDLVGVTANYSLKDDGTIKVVNRGFKGSLNGELSEAIGKTKIPDPNISAKIKVAFFLFFYADYFVLEVDEEYKWAVVGSSSDDYLWILSRTPNLDDGIYNTLLSKLTKRGYNVEKLILVEQKQ